MRPEDTDRIILFLAYLLAALSLLFIGYLGWRILRRRRHRHRHARPRSQQYRGTRGWG
jgi:hypothetical protein